MISWIVLLSVTSKFSSTIFGMIPVNSRFKNSVKVIMIHIIIQNIRIIDRNMNSSEKVSIIKFDKNECCESFLHILDHIQKFDPIQYVLSISIQSLSLYEKRLIYL